MSEQLFERGSLQIIRGAFQCGACGNVRRGTQRHSRSGWVSVCDECEKECQLAISPPILENPKANVGIESISSRRVSVWLEHLCGILDGEVAKLEALGIEAFSNNFNWLKECRCTAQWLWDTKFEIRSPNFEASAVRRLNVAVNELLKAWGRGGLTNPDETQRLMSALSEAFEPFKENL